MLGKMGVKFINFKIDTKFTIEPQGRAYAKRTQNLPQMCGGELQFAQ